MKIILDVKFKLAPPCLVFKYFKYNSLAAEARELGGLGPSFYTGRSSETGLKNPCNRYHFFSQGLGRRACASIVFWRLSKFSHGNLYFSPGLRLAI